MKRISLLLLAMLLVLGMLAGCNTKDDDPESQDPSSEEQGNGDDLDPDDPDWDDLVDWDSVVLKQFTDVQPGEQIAIVHTSMGDITLRLFPEDAPYAVENFVTHAQNGYYDNVIFHRVINNFMIQTGDPEGTGMGGDSIWGGAFEDEFSENLYNFRGALSMANTGRANTNGSQFFIVQAPFVEDWLIDQMIEPEVWWFNDEIVEKYRELGGTPWLDRQHTVFGHVIDGMDVVDAIAAVEVTDPLNEDYSPVESVIIRSVEITTY